MNLAKFDELDSLIRGMLYIETTNPRECYYWLDPTDDDKCQKTPYDFSEPYPFLVRMFRARERAHRDTMLVDRYRYRYRYRYRSLPFPCFLTIVFSSWST